MKICRFNNDQLGLVQEDNAVIDVTSVLDVLPAMRWPVPLGDALIYNLEILTSEIQTLSAKMPSIPLSQIILKSPVANPSKIIGAPIN